METLRQRRENDEIYVRKTKNYITKFIPPTDIEVTEQLQPKDEKDTATEDRTVAAHAAQENSKYNNPI